MLDAVASFTELVDCDCCGYDVYGEREEIHFNMTCNVSELQQADRFSKGQDQLCIDVGRKRLWRK